MSRRGRGSVAPPPTRRARRRRPRRRRPPAGCPGRCRADCAALLLDDSRHPAEEVAEVVRQVGVVAPDEALVGEVTVLSVRRLGEHVVAEAVDPDGVDQVERVDDVAARLAHLLAAGQQPPADCPAPRWLQPGRQQHGRPVDAVVADDVLADQVEIDRPPAGEALIVGAIANGGEVVRQGVEPDVGDASRPTAAGSPSAATCG